MNRIVLMFTLLFFTACSFAQTVLPIGDTGVLRWNKGSYRIDESFILSEIANSLELNDTVLLCVTRDSVVRAINKNKIGSGGDSLTLQQVIGNGDTSNKDFAIVRSDYLGRTSIGDGVSEDIPPNASRVSFYVTSKTSSGSAIGGVGYGIESVAEYKETDGVSSSTTLQGVSGTAVVASGSQYGLHDHDFTSNSAGADMVGVKGNAYTFGSGTTTSAAGVTAITDAYDTSHINFAANFLSVGSKRRTHTQIDSFAGLFLQQRNSILQAGTLSHNYGIWFDAMTSGTYNYGLYFNNNPNGGSIASATGEDISINSGSELDINSITNINAKLNLNGKLDATGYRGIFDNTYSNDVIVTPDGSITRGTFPAVNFNASSIFNGADIAQYIEHNSSLGYTIISLRKNFNSASTGVRGLALTMNLSTNINSHEAAKIGWLAYHSDKAYSAEAELALGIGLDSLLNFNSSKIYTKRDFTVHITGEDGRLLLGADLSGNSEGISFSNDNLHGLSSEAYRPTLKYSDFHGVQAKNMSTNTVTWRITKDDNMLIGTTTDNGVDKLQVNGSASFADIIRVDGVAEYTDNTDAISNGLSVGDIYRTGDILKIVH